MLKGKTVLLGVTGSIAAYKIASLASALKKLHADVHVLMTENATNFINPITFETLTGNKCLVDTFDRNFQYSVEHVSLAKKADVVMLAPASANVIGKIAHGIADDMLTTTIMACKCKKIVAPAMNTNMFENPIVQDNLKVLEHYNYEVISPAVGYLACGDTGAGKMPEPELLLEYILREIAREKDMKGLHVLVTAGPTQESVDPVRYITNHSTGKMGYAIAKVCMQRGADVTLVTGPTSIEKPHFVNVVPITTAREMFEEVTGRAEEQDIIIKAAAVADYRPRYVSDEKVKKKDDDLALEMERTDDILAYLGAHKTKDQFLCGFSMETENMLENSRKKLKKKNLDMIIANSLKMEGAGFGGNTNVVTVITEDFEKELGKLTKEETADRILDQILAQRGEVKKMILTIDIGNTNIVLGCIDGDKTLFVERLSTVRTKTELEYAIDIKNVLDIYHIHRDEIEGGIISSVVPQITTIVKLAVEKILKKNVLVVGAGIKTGLNIRIDNPAQLGSDLVVDSVAAIVEYPAPLLIFDLGTANTVCVIDKNKNYIGGMIYPGIGVSLDSLTAHASQLGGISIEAPEHMIGKNTTECMKSGLIYSSAAAMDGIIDRLQEQLGGEATVIATGGLAKKIVSHCRREIILDDDLLLKGLAIIYKKNRK